VGRDRSVVVGRGGLRGGVVSVYRGASLPTSITAGSDGALWFTSSEDNSIGRITTAGVATIYTAQSISYPTSITAGPDGALWFINSGDSSIGPYHHRRSRHRLHRRRYRIPDAITTGPDGALWFTNRHSIGRITSAGRYPSTHATVSDAQMGSPPPRWRPVVHERE